MTRFLGKASDGTAPTARTAELRVVVGQFGGARLPASRGSGKSFGSRLARTLVPPTFWPNCATTEPQHRFQDSRAARGREHSGGALSN